MKTFAFVFARGGSKGVPKKNVRKFFEKPLLVYSLESAKENKEISNIFVSTEDKEIAELSKKWGATVIHRPVELAQDDSPEWSAWQHAVKWTIKNHGDFERFISLPATSPLRNSKDIQVCLDALDSETDIVITINETNHSPWFNMVSFGDDGFVKRLRDGSKHFNRRQDVPKSYNVNTIAYVSRPSYILSNENLFYGKVKATIIPIERSIDIDTELDWEIAEF